MWCHTRLLPLVINELIPQQDSKWDNFTLMLTIWHSFAPVTSEVVVPYLRTPINDHHEAFSELYPSCPIISKMHYFLWLAAQVHALYMYIDNNVKAKSLIFHVIEVASSLFIINLLYTGVAQQANTAWCMRFESKHTYFKSLSHRVKSFKNIFASRHQTIMCYYLAIIATQLDLQVMLYMGESRTVVTKCWNSNYMYLFLDFPCLLMLLVFFPLLIGNVCLSVSRIS